MSALGDPRVLFAAERTLLAWNRTSLSLIALGFVIERAGLLIRAISPSAVPAGQLGLTFWLGISFIALGAIASGYSARQYAVVLRALTPAEFPPDYPAKWGMLVNVVVALLGGLLVFSLVAWRLH